MSSPLTWDIWGQLLYGTREIFPFSGGCSLPDWYLESCYPGVSRPPPPSLAYLLGTDWVLINYWATVWGFASFGLSICGQPLSSMDIRGLSLKGSHCLDLGETGVGYLLVYFRYGGKGEGSSAPSDEIVGS